MKSAYICDREKSQVEAVKSSQSPFIKAGVYILIVASTTRIKPSCAGFLGCTHLFYTLPVLIHHRTSEIKGGAVRFSTGSNPEYLLHTPLIAKKSQLIKGYVGRPVPGGSDHVSEIGHVRKGEANKNWSGELLMQVVGILKEVFV